MIRALDALCKTKERLDELQALRRTYILQDDPDTTLESLEKRVLDAIERGDTFCYIGPRRPTLFGYDTLTNLGYKIFFRSTLPAVGVGMYLITWSTEDVSEMYPESISPVLRVECDKF